MILILGAQNDLGMAQKSITQSSDWTGSCLIAKSQSTLNSESTRGANFFGGNILPPNFQIRPLKTDRFFFWIKFVIFSLAKTWVDDRIRQNPYVLFEFCVGAGGSWSEMTPPPKNRGAPAPKVINHPELGKNGTFFVFLHGAPRILGGGVVSPCRNVARTQNYNST